MISRRTFLTSLSLAAGAAAAEIRPAGGMIRGGRINYVATYDADAQTYFTAVEANGGTLSAATKTAVNAFVVSAKANGYWTKLTRINLFCGDQLAAALVPLKVGGGNATDTNTNFVGGDYSEATGLTGNGTTKFLDTGLAGNATAANSLAFGVYVRSSASSDTNEIAAYDGVDSNAYVGLYARIGGDLAIFDNAYNTGLSRVSVANNNAQGFWISSRTAANSHKAYKNGSEIGSSAGAQGVVTSSNFLLYRSGGTYGAFVLAGYFVSEGLNGPEITSYNTDLETFQDALGRGVQ